MDTKYKKASALIAATLFLPLLSIAQTTPSTTPPGETGFWYNPLVLSLVGLIVILLFTIGVMGNVLINLVYANKEKTKNEKQSSNIVKTILLMFLFSIPAIQTYATDAPKPSGNSAQQGVGGISTTDFYTLISMIAFEIIILIALLFIMRVLLNTLRNKPVLARAEKVKARSAFWDRFNSAVSVEREADVMLDHNYDGIRELDNALPPWWKYGFYVTIIFACVYIYQHNISHTSMNSEEEYLAEVQKAKETQAAYLAHAANNIDENTVTTLTDAPSLSAGKAIFETTCAPCHLKDGGGIVGPNLTDDYWIHGGSIKDIFKTIKYGWQDKGMKSWKDDFSPKQIQLLASYVKSLHGTHPATPKDKQGELYIEAGQPTKATDSTKIDSVKTSAKPVASK